MNRDRATLLGILLCVTFVVVVRLEFSADGHVLDHGDIHTDQRAVVAAEEFRTVGFAGLNFMQTEDSIAQVGFKPSYYHRHPAGGVMALALLQDIGLSRAKARLLPLIATTIGLWGFFCFLRLVSGNDVFALMGLAMLACAAPFYLLADSFQLYSYGLMGKGLAFWLVARGAFAEGRRRLVPFSLNMLLSFFTVTFLGLESMPAVGLASFVAPLFLVEGRFWARFGVACMSATLAAVGMAAGWAVRIVNMLAAFEGDLDRTLGNLTGSLSSRSVGRELDINSAGREYLEEVTHRLSAYLSVHLILAALGLAVALFFAVRMRDAKTRLALAAVAICLLAEIPYFVLMRRHVYMHVHTTVHLTQSAAALAALGFGVWSGFTRRVQGVVGIAALGAIWAVLASSPKETYGNLVLPDMAGNPSSVEDELNDCLAQVPQGALVLVYTDQRYNWHLRCFTAMRGLGAIDLPPAGDRVLGYTVEGSEGLKRVRSGELEIERFVDAPQVHGRPIFLIAELRDQKAMDEASARWERLATSRRFALFGMARYAAAKEPLSFSVSTTTLRDFVQTSPTPEQMEDAGIRYRLTNRNRKGVWLHAPPASLGKPTTVRVPIATVDSVRRARCAVDYDKAEHEGQPDLVVAMRLYDGDEMVGKGQLSVSAGEIDKELAFELASSSRVDALEFELDLRPGLRHNSWARVVVGTVVLDP